jgi:hypothetical protein
MRKFSIRVPFVALAMSFSCLSLSSVQAQTPGAPGSNGGGVGSTTNSSATGINSATTQSPTTTFQLQDNTRNTVLNPVVMPSNRGTQPMQSFNPPSGLVQNHPPVIQTRSFGVPVNPQDMPRQAVTPNMLATPNAIAPQQVNRTIMTPPPAMPTYQKSQALQQLQPQLFKPQ